MTELEAIENHLREDEVLDPVADVVVRGWPLTVEGLLRNADATRSRFSLRGEPFAAISAEVTVAGWSLEAILSGPRLRTRSRYADAPVGQLLEAGFDLMPTFGAPHYSVRLDQYTSESVERLLEALGEVHTNPHHVGRQP